MKKYNLEPMRTSQKSFYGKAYVYEYELSDWRYYRLISYETPGSQCKGSGRRYLY